MLEIYDKSMSLIWHMLNVVVVAIVQFNLLFRSRGQGVKRIS